MGSIILAILAKCHWQQASGRLGFNSPDSSCQRTAKEATLSTMMMDYLQDPSFLKALGVLAVSLVLAGQFDNHLWRLILIAANFFALDTLPWYAFLVEAYLIMHIPHLRSRQSRKGCVFITGVDSGMVSLCDFMRLSSWQ